MQDEVWMLCEEEDEALAYGTCAAQYTCVFRISCVFWNEAIGGMAG